MNARPTIQSECRSVLAGKQRGCGAIQPMAARVFPAQRLPSAGALRPLAAALLAAAAVAGSQSVAAETASPAWWNPAWHFRAPYRAVVEAPATLTVKANFSRLLAVQNRRRAALEANSIRVIETSAGAEPLTCRFERAELYSATHNAAGVLTWRVPARPGAGERRFDIYFDIEAHGPKPPPAATDETLSPNLLPDPGFERKPEHNPPWKMARNGQDVYYPTWDDRAARSGAHSMRAETDARANCYGSTVPVGAALGRAYRMSIWYRVDAAGAGEVTPCINFWGRDAKGGYKMCKTYAQRGMKPGEWVRVERTVTPRPGTTLIWLGYGIHASHGAAWFDDADIRPAAFDELTAIETLSGPQPVTKKELP